MKNLSGRTSKRKIRVLKIILFFLAVGVVFGLRARVSQEEVVPPIVEQDVSSQKPPQSSSDASSLSGEGPDEEKIDLNNASLEDLMRLPGIGEKLARRIKEYKDLNGPFHTIDSVMEINGVGLKLFNKIQPYITVESKR